MAQVCLIESGLTGRFNRRLWPQIVGKCSFTLDFVTVLALAKSADDGTMRRQLTGKITR